MVENMSINDTSEGGTNIVTNYCGKCGKPFTYVGDWFDTTNLPYCQCPKEEYPATDTPWVGTFINPNMGWECPKCQRVYAPFVKECDTCNLKKSYTATAGGEIEDNDE